MATRLDFDRYLNLLEDVADAAIEPTWEGRSLLYRVSPSKALMGDEFFQPGHYRLQLPPLAPVFSSDASLDYFVEEQLKLWQCYGILLIQAGQAALGVWAEDRLERHKVIRKYMVRKSQGRSQLSYLHSKGKSRLGSRIRLQQTQEFFSEINEYLEKWEDFKTCGRIVLSCSPKLLGAWFQANPPKTLSKHDVRLTKVGCHVHRPTLAELERIQRFVQSGWIEKVDENGDGSSY